METLVTIFIIYLIYALFFKKKSPKINKKDEIYTTYSNESFDGFRISYEYDDEPKTNNKALGIWIQPEETVVVCGNHISGGFFYFGGQLEAIAGSGMESSLVDGMLPIDAADIEYEDRSLDYWPKFNSLSPEGRGAYISWLASDRNNPDTPIGYVFIYFYGLERRILVDFANGEVSDEECRHLYDEILRLREIYKKNWSFNQYSARLIEYLCIMAPQIISIEDDAIEHSVESLLFKYRLATVVNAEEPLSPQLAFSWINDHPDHRLRTPARRCRKEFRALFIMLYSDRYGDGFTVKPNKTKLRLDYTPASSSLRGLEAISFDLPNPSVLMAPVKKLASIAQECMDMLDPYSRYLGRKGTSTDDLAGVLLLPDELLGKLNIPVFVSFKTWAEGKISNSEGLVNIEDLWTQTGLPLPDKINKKEMELITNIVSKSGFGMAPDPRYHHAKPTMDGQLVLFSEGHGSYFKPSKCFYDVGIKLRLGAIVANADAQLHSSEISMLNNLIDHDTNLSPTEQRSLHAYLLWRLNTPTKMSGLKARLEELKDEEKSVVSKILVGVALADGILDPREIKQLEKLYVALGLDKLMVTTDIHALSSFRADIKTNSKVVQASSVNIDENTRSVSAFNLDDSVLAIHESETQDVQNMLGAIFVDDKFEDETLETEVLENSYGDSSIDNMDEKLRKFYNQLISKDEWPRETILKICSELGLMIEGAIDAINDWSFDNVDAPLLEDNGNIFVDREIANELKELEG